MIGDDTRESRLASVTGANLRVYFAWVESKGDAGERFSPLEGLPDIANLKGKGLVSLGVRRKASPGQYSEVSGRRMSSRGSVSLSRDMRTP